MLKRQANKERADKMQANTEDVKPQYNKGPWSQNEDRTLMHLVATRGAHSWVRISTGIQVRSAKQCRERYHQNLKSSLTHDSITPEEGEIIERWVNEVGKKWAEIARHLPGRSDNSVKNWWNGGMNRRRRMVVRRDGNARGGSAFDETVESLSFARPAPPPTRQIIVPTSRRTIDPPLISPANSEVSMPDSLGDAPSLMSDASSHLSMSSPHAYSHHHHAYLPPPGGPTRGDYWGQAPMLRSTSYPSVIPSTIAYDRSPPAWSHNEMPKPPYDLAQPHQRLQQFAEVATTRAPVESSNVQFQHTLQPRNQMSSFGTLMSNTHGHPQLPALPGPQSISNGSRMRPSLELSTQDPQLQISPANRSYSTPAGPPHTSPPSYAPPAKTVERLLASSTTVPESLTLVHPRTQTADDAEVSQQQPVKQKISVSSLLR